MERLLVVGSGVAGCTSALIAAEVHRIPSTVVFAGREPFDCNSFWAQGGIIYRNYNFDSGDSDESLAADIHRAGAGLCDDAAVRKVSVEGPERVKQLLLDESETFANVPFDRKDNGELSLCLEASHSAPRILHIGDHTGKIITERITQAAAKHPLIDFQHMTIATDLIVRDGVCVGVKTLHGQELATHGVVLCSGGLAGIYSHSTNPSGFNALGSSVAIASRSNVKTKGLEYIQFHPTALTLKDEAPFLLTEALRGEGAVLKNAEGVTFAKSFHEAGELAPRDVVARGVFAETQRTGQVFLDITHRDREWLHRRFPTIQAHLERRGMDIAQDQLPITPAAHYTCGGIHTDLDGRTSLPGLFAAGEAACTGLHGGNRLASTSLLEGLVFGAAVGDFCGSEEGRELSEETKIVLNANGFNSVQDDIRNADIDDDIVVSQLQELRQTMWDNVGLVRTRSGLRVALESLRSIQEHADELFLSAPCRNTAGLRDAAHAGVAVTKAALGNTVSAGTHFLSQRQQNYEVEGDMVLSS